MSGIKNIKPGQVAFVTQSYRGDLEECRLLCESIDRFAPEEMRHYIFVNDEDYRLFRDAGFSSRHEIRRKGEVLPWWLVRFPWKVLGHKWHVGVFSLPVREWIVQQLCKLGAFDVLGDEIEAIVHLDSEVVMTRPFSLDDIYDRESGRFVLYRRVFEDEPCHRQYCEVAKGLLGVDAPVDVIAENCYMAQATVFVRENVERLLARIAKRSPFGSWKLRLCNTYRFSEFYLYGIFTEYALAMNNHKVIDHRLFPVVHVAGFDSADALGRRVRELTADGSLPGVWVQKSTKNISGGKKVSIDDVRRIVAELPGWGEPK